MEKITTILVVDDEVGIRQLFSEILTDEGYHVITADSGKEADKLILSEEPDVVLLDIWLPDTDGMSLLKQWASTGPLPCPIIMVSGHASIDMAVEATKIGAFTFLEKPVSMRSLIETVQSAAKTSPRQKAIAKNFRKTAQQISTSVDTQNPLAGEDTPRGRIDFALPFREARDQFERAYFAFLLDKYKGNITKVAQHAQVERTNLYRKLDFLGIERSDKKRNSSS